MKRLLVILLSLIALPMSAVDWKMIYIGLLLTGQNEEARNMLTAMAELDDVEAQYNLGILYFEQHPVDYDKAYYWLYQAAKQYDCSAQYYVGFMHEHGLGVERGEKQAMEWYLKAAAPIRTGTFSSVSKWEKRYASNAQYRLGAICEKNGDMHSALKWYKKSSKLKNDSAQLALGNMYEQGKGVSLNYKKAARYYRRAAKKRYVPTIETKEGKSGSWHIQSVRIARQNAEALYRYGLMCHDGRYGAHDYFMAKHYFAKAALQGHPLAQMELGLMYKRGQTVKPDWIVAAQWLSKAAEQGTSEAQFHLAKMLDRGEHGLERDTSAAVRFYKQAYEGHHKMAQYVLQERGITPPDSIEPHPKRRIALLIGNGDYSGKADLGNPRADVIALSSKLENIGFETWAFINYTKKEMEDSIESFCKEATRCEAVLVFFAGHGTQDLKDCYLYPAKSHDLYSTEEAFPLSKIVKTLKDNSNSNNIILVDACRLPTQDSEQDNGLSFDDSFHVSLSTGLYRSAADGKPQEHSPYMKSLLRALDEPNLRIRDVLKYVEENVQSITNGMQVPYTKCGAIKNDIILNRQ